MSIISFTPKTPHHTMRNKPPYPKESMTLQTALTAIKERANTTRHNPTNPKQTKHYGPNFLHKKTVQQQMINTFSISLAQTTPFRQDKTTSSHVIHGQNFFLRQQSKRKMQHGGGGGKRGGDSFAFQILFHGKSLLGEGLKHL